MDELDFNVPSFCGQCDKLRTEIKTSKAEVGLENLDLCKVLLKI